MGSLGKKLLKQPRDSHLPPLSVNKDKTEVTLTFLLAHQVSIKIFTILQRGGLAFLFVQPKEATLDTSKAARRFC